MAGVDFWAVMGCDITRPGFWASKGFNITGPVFWTVKVCDITGPGFWDMEGLVLRHMTVAGCDCLRLAWVSVSEATMGRLMMWIGD